MPSPGVPIGRCLRVEVLRWRCRPILGRSAPRWLGALVCLVAGAMAGRPGARVWLTGGERGFRAGA